MADIPYHDASAVGQAVSMKQAVELMREAFAALSNGLAVVPQRINMPLTEGDCALVMPVYLPGLGQYGVKTVSVNHGNPAGGLPRLHAVFTLFDAVTGQPLASFDAEFITALRTGAGAGLATDLLAAPEASELVIIGAGHQARTQLEAMAAVRELSRVHVISSRRERAEAFARTEAARYPFPVLATEDRSVLRSADLICTATSSASPVFEDIELPEVVHINGVGSYHRGMAEVPPRTVARSVLVPDQRQACLAEAGDITQAIDSGYLGEDDIFADLGELAAGRATPPARGTRLTFFKSVGNAVQDLAVAGYAYRELCGSKAAKA